MLRGNYGIPDGTGVGPAGAFEQKVTVSPERLVLQDV